MKKRAKWLKARVKIRDAVACYWLQSVIHIHSNFL